MPQQISFDSQRLRRNNKLWPRKSERKWQTCSVRIHELEHVQAGEVSGRAEYCAPFHLREVRRNSDRHVVELHACIGDDARLFTKDKIFEREMTKYNINVKKFWNGFSDKCLDDIIRYSKTEFIIGTELHNKTRKKATKKVNRHTCVALDDVARVLQDHRQ